LGAGQFAWFDRVRGVESFFAINRDKRRNGSFTLPDGFRMLHRASYSTARDNGRKEHLHMGDKGGKKDKAKSKQQQDAKQKAEVKRNEEKSPRKTS